MAASQQQGPLSAKASAFRSGRLAPSAADRQTCGNGQLVFSLKEGNSASLEALNKAFLTPSTAMRKTSGQKKRRKATDNISRYLHETQQTAPNDWRW